MGRICELAGILLVVLALIEAMFGDASSAPMIALVLMSGGFGLFFIALIIAEVEYRNGFKEATMRK